MPANSYPKSGNPLHNRPPLFQLSRVDRHVGHLVGNIVQTCTKQSGETDANGANLPVNGRPDGEAEKQYQMLADKELQQRIEADGASPYMQEDIKEETA